MNNRFFLKLICILLVIIFACPLTNFFLCQSGVLTNTNVGNVINVDKVYDENLPGASILNGFENFKRTIKDIYTNYIPFYVNITTSVRAFEEMVNGPLSDLLFKKGNELSRVNLKTETVPDEITHSIAITDIKTQFPATAEKPEIDYESFAEVSYLRHDDRYNYYEIKSNPGNGAEPLDFYVRILLDSKEVMHSKMLSQVSNYNKIANNYDVNLYVYAASTFHDSAACDVIIPAVSQHEMFKEFFSLLDDKIIFGYSDVDSLEAYSKNFWKTDIHWNHNGYAAAYDEICNMLSKNYDDITPRKAQKYEFEDITFYGSYALALSNYKLGDTFGVTMYDLPLHNFSKESNIQSCSMVPAEENLAQYQAGNFPKFQTYNYYMQFFRIAHEINYPENHTGRNLLLLCDSYSPPLQEVVASHFDTTYLRYVGTQQYSPASLDLSYYIDNFGVTDVMVIQMSDRAIYNPYGDSLYNLKIS